MIFSCFHCNAGFFPPRAEVVQASQCNIASIGQNGPLTCPGGLWCCTSFGCAQFPDGSCPGTAACCQSTAGNSSQRPTPASPPSLPAPAPCNLSAGPSAGTPATRRLLSDENSCKAQYDQCMFGSVFPPASGPPAGPPTNDKSPTAGPNPPSGTCKAPYNQCGGLNCPPDSPQPCQDAATQCCSDGFTCAPVNPYFWQCMPGSASPPASGSSAGSPPASIPSAGDKPPTAGPVPPPGTCKAPYDQCGGLNCPPDSPQPCQDAATQCCSDGFTCAPLNPYFWQCRPGTSSPPASGSSAGSPPASIPSGRPPAND